MNNYRDKRSEDNSYNKGGRNRSYNRNEENNGRPKFGQRSTRYGENRPTYGNHDEGNRFKFNNRADRGTGTSRFGYDRGTKGRYDEEQGRSDYRRPRFRQNDSEQTGNRSAYNSYDNGSSRGERYNAHGGDRKPAYGSRPRSGSYDANAKYNRKKQIEYKEVISDPDAPMRLNKYLANAGICSRREADDFIQAGLVTVNGAIVTELGTKITRNDDIRFNGERINPERKVYILLNKPKDCVTTVDDPQERKTVLDCLKGACKERIYPVGRLDRNTTGVLLLTNDGDMASKLTHPKFMKKKIYHVYCDKNVAMSDMTELVNGLELEDGRVYADEVKYVNDADRSQIGLEIHSGKNRIVRRMMEHLGYKVIKLDRVLFAGLTKKNLKRGDWRYLTEKEVNMLRMGAYE